MALLKKSANVKPLTAVSRGGSGRTVSSLRPQPAPKLPPCMENCPSGSNIREWIGVIAQREKLGLTTDQAMEKAFRIVADKNPFPATLGRVCPHPCEKECTRTLKDTPVSINAMERFLGDWALEHKFALNRLEEDTKAESIGVIGAGPAGMSFAYQLARRGYKVTVYEKTDKAGGMLLWGIPFYRLPAEPLKAENQRIFDLGVEIRLGTTIGTDVPVGELKKRHQVIFVGIGAHRGKSMGIPGEEGPCVFTGTDYLHRVKKGETVDVGRSVAVIGGGDTAIDAARAARRAGAEVTILYRRTRTEMPAIASEIEDALKEDVKIELLVAPLEVKRADGKVRGIIVQKMALGEPDESGRRRPVPLPGSEYEIPVDSIVAAISQEPDWGPLNALRPAKGPWVQASANGEVGDNVWAGGDVVGLALATVAIGQGRHAAEAVHAALRGLEPPKKDWLSPLNRERIKLDFYEAKPRVEMEHLPVEEWLKRPDDEIAKGLSPEEFFREVSRCFSCGLCFACERCWMYCTPSCFSKVSEPSPGNFYKIKLELCDGCKKCAEECPCAFMDMA